MSTPSVAPVTPIATANVEFRVQFLSNDKELPSGSPKLKGVDQVKFYKMGAVYKYTSGSYASPEAASAQQAKLKTMGFADCFVVAFKNGQRIDMTEAKKLIGR